MAKTLEDLIVTRWRSNGDNQNETRTGRQGDRSNSPKSTAKALQELREYVQGKIDGNPER